MSNVDFFNYEGQKAAAKESYDASTAKNAYARFLAQQRGARRKFDLQQGYEQQAPRVVSSFTRRGLAGPGVRSGVYERGLTEFAKRNLDELVRTEEDISSALRGSELDDASLLAQYNQRLIDIDQEKQRRIAEQAALLRGFQPFLGG
jgi:hypothetical protein